MKIKAPNRQLLFALTMLFYLIPIMFFVVYCIAQMSHTKSWTILCIGLLLAVCCSLVLMLLIYYWEQEIKNKQNEILVDVKDHSQTIQKKITALDTAQLALSPFEKGCDGSSNDNKIYSANQNTTMKNGDDRIEEIISNKELAKMTDEHNLLKAHLQQTTREFEDYKLLSEDQLRQKQDLLNGLQNTVDSNKIEIEHKQEQIHQLDTQIHDLSYEIKTLLYLHESEKKELELANHASQKIENYLLLKDSLMEMHFKENNFASEKYEDIIYSSATPVSSTASALHLLKKYIDMSQKLMGATNYGVESNRYRKFPSHYHAIDQRRLFDNLKDETGAMVLVYSQKEQKVLFVNQQVKLLLGWSPEKFIMDFAYIFQEGLEEWNKALNRLSSLSDTYVRCLVKGKDGQEVLINCHLGIIRSGLFKNSVIGVLYPA